MRKENYTICAESVELAESMVKALKRARVSATRTGVFVEFYGTGRKCAAALGMSAAAFAIATRHGWITARV